MILPDDKFRELILTKKLLAEKELTELAEVAKNSGVSLQAAFLAKDPSFDEKVSPLIAESLKVPYVLLSKLAIPEECFYLIPERIARKLKVVVFFQDQKDIKIATAEPANEEIKLTLAKKTGKNIIVHYASEKDIDNILQLYKRDLQKTVDGFLKEASSSNPNNVFEDAPVAKIVDTLIHGAYQDKASDIHVEPEEKSSLVRFRIDGMLHDILRMPKYLHERVVSRIKVLSNLRTDEHLSAQDGKMRMVLEEENLDIRVSIIPIVEGEKIVLRLLSSNSRQFTLTDLGMNEADLKKVTNAFNKSFGMVLSTGPTGSGKTTSIYSILKLLNKREQNITTVEDPVEYRIGGANQIQVNVKTNLTFANGLRSILRQDPNIIFVGEIRDAETAGIAVNAALTGHLVFSTLHTNDAATAIPRLTDMKVEPFLVASTVNVIIGQRLVRKICEVCRYSLTITQETLEKDIPNEILLKHYIPVGENKEIRIYQGKGCKACHFSGYKGRIGVFEILEITPKIREMITAKSDADQIGVAARAEGMTSMLDDGLQKVAKGMTTIEEVLRVVKTEFL